MPLLPSCGIEGFSANFAFQLLLFFYLKRRILNFINLLLFFSKDFDKPLSFRAKDLITRDVNFPSFTKP
jgi:hypothetical protein